MTAVSVKQRIEVALLAEGVDRNRLFQETLKAVRVALLAEGVDRNRSRPAATATVKRSPSSRRAWIEISFSRSGCRHGSMSPSSRRAWIEIVLDVIGADGYRRVALLAEGVDRNLNSCYPYDTIYTSPSPRRAWIEIGCDLSAATRGQVALLAESVDRNYQSIGIEEVGRCRPPRGGRG